MLILPYFALVQNASNPSTFLDNNWIDVDGYLDESSAFRGCVAECKLLHICSRALYLGADS